MNAPESRASPVVVPSPCVDICRIEPGTGWCEGCLRTIDEIAAWSALDNLQKRAVWKQLSRRRAMAATAAPREELP